MNVSISRRGSANWGMANVSSAVRQAGNIFYLLVLFYVEENRYQVKFSMSIPNVIVGLFFGDHIIPEDADVADLDFDDIARNHVAISPLGTHPEHVARVQGRVPAQFLNPCRRIPDLVG